MTYSKEKILCKSEKLNL